MQGLDRYTKYQEQANALAAEVINLRYDLWLYCESGDAKSEQDMVDQLRVLAGWLNAIGKDFGVKIEFSKE